MSTPNKMARLFSEEGLRELILQGGRILVAEGRFPSIVVLRSLGISATYSVISRVRDDLVNDGSLAIPSDLWPMRMGCFRRIRAAADDTPILPAMSRAEFDALRGRLLREHRERVEASMRERFGGTHRRGPKCLSDDEVYERVVSIGREIIAHGEHPSVARLRKLGVAACRVRVEAAQKLAANRGDLVISRGRKEVNPLSTNPRREQEDFDPAEIRRRAAAVRWFRENHRRLPSEEELQKHLAAKV